TACPCAPSACPCAPSAPGSRSRPRESRDRRDATGANGVGLSRALRARLLRGDEGARELARVERLEIFESLAHAHELDRQAELVRNRHGDSALRAPVELRQRDAGHVPGLVEDPGLW